METNVVIITGAGSGIGRAAAIRFAAASYELVLAARTERSLQETRQIAGRGEVVVTDVSQPDPVQRLIDTTLERFGRLDVLVHCAGFAPLKSLAETTPELWREVMDVNVSSALYLARAAWPTFVKQQSGVIVNISSLAARDPFSGFFAYGAAKAALNNLGITLAREGKHCGIRVHTIAPGMTDTPMLRNLLGDGQAPAEAMMAPDEVAEAIVACVDGGLKHTSGETIYIRRGS